MLQLARKIFIIAMTVVMAACAKGQKGKAGAEGGAGGEFIYNSKEDVVRTVNEVWAQLSDPTLANPLNTAYTILQAKGEPNENDLKLKGLLRKIMDVKGKAFFPINGTEVSEYIKSIKFTLNESGPCSGPEDHKYLASVTRLDREGAMCFSVHGLMRWPSAALRIDLLALMVHQLAHLNGFAEVDARNLQKYFLTNHKQILRKDSHQTRGRFAYTIWWEVNSQWPALITTANLDGLYIRKLQELQYGLQKVAVKYFSDMFPGDDVDIQRPQLLSSLQKRLRELRAAIIEHGQAAARIVDQNKFSKLTSKQFTVIRAIALQMIELQREIDLYYHGDKLDPTIARMYDREIALVMQVTEPSILKNPATLAELYCHPKPARDLSTWGRAHPLYHTLMRNRCSTMEPESKAKAGGGAEDPDGGLLDDHLNGNR